MINEVNFTCDNVQIDTDLLYKMLPADHFVEMIKRRDKKIKQLEEEKEGYKNALTSREIDYANVLVELKEVSKQLSSFTDHYPTAAEMLKKQEEFAANVGKLTVQIERMKQQGVTMDMVEKAAFDILSWYIKDEDEHGGSRNGSMFAMTQDHALALMLTTRLVERIKYYVKKR